MFDTSVYIVAKVLSIEEKHFSYLGYPCIKIPYTFHLLNSFFSLIKFHFF